MSWEYSVYLKDGEKIVCNWWVDCETSHTVIVQRGKYVRRHRPQEVKERRRGVARALPTKDFVTNRLASKNAAGFG